MAEDAAKKPPFTVVIADDHALIRDSLKQLVGGLPDLTVVAEAENGLEAISAVKRFQPSLVLLDMAMPYAQGTEVFGEVRRWSPATKVAVLTGLTGRGLLSDLIAAEVDGLFLKRGDTDELRHGLPLILRGGKYIAADVLNLLEDRPASADLTLRERQILSLISAGHTNAEIGARLSISHKTVDNHRTNLMGKLGVHSVAELLAYALREGLLEPNRQL